MTDVDLEEIRKAVNEKLDPDWVKKHGGEAWKAALALIGEPADEEP